MSSIESTVLYALTVKLYELPIMSLVGKKDMSLTVFPLVAKVKGYSVGSKSTG